MPNPASHLTPGCTCTHAPGLPCDWTCPVHRGAAPGAWAPAPRSAMPRACPRRVAHLPHGACPGTAPEYPSEAIEVVTEGLPDMWQSATGEDATVYAAMFRAAAAIITNDGYNSHDDYEGEQGTSISAALAEAARDRAGWELEQGSAVYGDDQWARHLEAGAEMWRRELEVRLAAVLFATGQQLYDHRSALTEVPLDWEKRWNHDAPAPDQGRALGLLATAAALYDLLGKITTDTRARTFAALNLEGE